jgi:hypothetical protein
MPDLNGPVAAPSMNLMSAYWGVKDRPFRPQELLLEIYSGAEGPRLGKVPAPWA